MQIFYLLWGLRKTFLYIVTLLLLSDFNFLEVIQCLRVKFLNKQNLQCVLWCGYMN